MYNRDFLGVLMSTSMAGISCDEDEQFTEFLRVDLGCVAGKLRRRGKK